MRSTCRKLVSSIRVRRCALAGAFLLVNSLLSPFNALAQALYEPFGIGLKKPGNAEHASLIQSPKTDAAAELAASQAPDLLLYEPIDLELANKWRVNPNELIYTLGIDFAAEANWKKKYDAECAPKGASQTPCSFAGKSLNEMKALADSGSPFHQNNYAQKLVELVQRPASDKEAHEYYLAAARQGLPHAQVSVGWNYLHGLGVERDVKAAFEWNSRGAKQGHPEGANNLGFQYQYGLGVERDKKTAISWYTYAALRGSSIAYGSLIQLRNDE